VQYVADGDLSSSWSIAMPADIGVNRYLISQRIFVGGEWRQSKDNVFITQRLDTNNMPTVNPTVTLNTQWKNYKQVKFDIEAEAAGGLSLVNWWVERLTTSGYRTVQYAGHNRPVEGAAKMSVTHFYNFSGDGTYRIKVRAYGYGVNPSSIQTLEFVVGSGAAINVDHKSDIFERAIQKNTLEKERQLLIQSPLLKKAN